MKSHYLLITILFFGIISLMVFDAAFNEANSHTSGAPAIRTGSPGDGGATCKNCHAGPTPTTQAGLITSTIPAAGYTGGQTYTVTGTITRSGHVKFGFEISPQNAAGTQLGTMIVTSTQTQLVGSGKYITHTSSGVSGTNTKSWSFNWTAPAAGTGNVTFYGAFNITNNGNNSSGDTTVLSTLVVSECAAPAQPGTISGNTTVCSGSTQSYSITAVSGASSYTWTLPSGWTGSSSSTSISAIAGTSGGTISVLASNSCGNSTVRTLTVAIDQLAVTASATNVSCNGGSNGTATATSSSGVAPYIYLWSPVGGTGATANNLAPGTYTVTVTDAAGCTKTSSPVVITQPSPIALNATGSSSHCGNANGSASVVATGGTGPYTYLWTPGNLTTATISNLAAGTYSVSVTDSHGCTATTSATVTNIGGPTASIASQTNVSCNGGNNGSATATQTGGSAPYTYSWSPGNGTSATQTGMSAGNYAVTVTDANGCMSTANVVITQPSPIAANATSSSSHCGNADGSVSVVATGGTGSYTYSWAPGNGASATMNNIAAGNYTVTVTDANGCSTTASTTVTNIAGPSASITSLTNVSCNGGNNGSATATQTGGTAPFTYSWSGGGTAITASNLAAGSYTVTITDAFGCISTASVTITEPSAISLNTSTANSTCGNANGTASVTASGGTAGYTYSWNSVPVQTSATAINLLAGNYTVIVTDAHSCTATVSVSVSNTAGPTATASVVNNVTCNGGLDGAAIVAVSGGTGPFTYFWASTGNRDSISTNLSAGIYLVTVTDTNGCTSTSSTIITEPTAIILTSTSDTATCGQSNGVAIVSATGGTGNFSYGWNTVPIQTNDTAINLAAGSYVVTVIDSSGCVATANVGVNNISGPTLQAGPSNDATCFNSLDGSLSVIVTGGTGPFTYFWSSTGDIHPVSNNLHAGPYSVTVTDSFGCVSVMNAMVNEPPELIANAGFGSTICEGVSVTLGNSPVAIGGTSGYTYLWNHASDLSSAIDSTPVATPALTTDYMLIVTDAHGCVDTSNVTINVNPIPAIPVVSVTTDSLFSTPANSYQWYLDGVLIPGFTSQLCVPFQNGNYSVVITDANGCSSTSADFAYNSTLVKDESQILFSVYPNPAQTELKIKNLKLRIETVEIRIYDLVGENVLVVQSEINNPKSEMSVDVSTLPSGLYVIEISSGEKVWRGKFVKE